MLTETEKLRFQRLNLLRRTVELHAEAKGEPVKLNGESREWDMNTWDCGTAACAYGSYVLVPSVRNRLEEEIMPNPLSIIYKEKPGQYFAANCKPQHEFHISEREADWLFDPHYYLVRMFDAPPSEAWYIPPRRVLGRINLMISRYARGVGDLQNVCAEGHLPKVYKGGPYGTRTSA